MVSPDTLQGSTSRPQVPPPRLAAAPNTTRTRKHPFEVVIINSPKKRVDDNIQLNQRTKRKRSESPSRSGNPPLAADVATPNIATESVPRKKRRTLVRHRLHGVRETIVIHGSSSMEDSSDDCKAQHSSVKGRYTKKRTGPDTASGSTITTRRYTTTKEISDKQTTSQKMDSSRQSGQMTSSAGHRLRDSNPTVARDPKRTSHIRQAAIIATENPTAKTMTSTRTDQRIRPGQGRGIDGNRAMLSGSFREARKNEGKITASSKDHHQKSVGKNKIAHQSAKKKISRQFGNIPGDVHILPRGHKSGASRGIWDSLLEGYAIRRRIELARRKLDLVQSLSHQDHKTSKDMTGGSGFRDRGSIHSERFIRGVTV